MKNSIQNLVEKYKSEPSNKEFEIRILDLDLDKWISCYKKCCEKYGNTFQIEQSINLISKSGRNSQGRKTIFFKDGKKGEEIEVLKSDIISFVLDKKKYSLSEELSSKVFNPTMLTLIRIKLRASFTYLDWRIDFTIVREIQNTEKNIMLSEKNRIFPEGKKINLNNFIDFIFSLGDVDKHPYRHELEIEYVGNAENLEENPKNTIESIIESFDPDSRRTGKIRDIARMFIEEKHRIPSSLKAFVNQPISLNIDSYKKNVIPEIDNFYLSDKADGERALLYLDDNKAELIRSTNIMNVTDIIFDKKKSNKGKTLLDTEVIISDDKITKIYLFDVLMLEDENISSKNFEDREKLLSDIADKFSITEKKIQIKLTKENYKEELTKVYKRKNRLYPIDGLIFTPFQGNYFDMKVYKWKPPENNTIDFLIVSPNERLIGLEPYTVAKNEKLYFLLCGIRYNVFKSLGMEYFPNYSDTMEALKINIKEEYFPIQFSTSDNPLAYIWRTKSKDDYNGHVGEFKYMESGWELIKMREDKDVIVREGVAYGNDFQVAEETYRQFFNPFTFEMLLDSEAATNYFATEKKEIYKPITKFNNFVKAQIIRQLENSEFVIDLASGKGQDLFTLAGFGIKNILCVDNDAMALEELNKRKYNIMKKEYYIYGEVPTKAPNIYTKKIDLSKDHDKILKELKTLTPDKGVDGIIMNFAIHYLLDHKDNLNGLIKIVDSLLRPGGIFMFTCFDGERIFEILKDIDFEKSWDIHQNEVLKYSIKKLYQSDEFTDFGQEIGVLLPFSDGEYYTENLVNIDNIISKFQDKNYEVRQNSSFINWLEKFKSFNTKVYSEMNSDDINFVKNYHYVTLWKPI